MPANQLIIVTDLDGCLLNKHDYRWQDAEECLRRLMKLEIPVVLSSSKTVSEMAHLAAELPIIDAPFASENGGAICWRNLANASDVPVEIRGADRTQILDLLESLHSKFQFRSFRDLGLKGVIQATDLSEAAATRALDRHSTEPLLWDDSDENRQQFAAELQTQGLSLTRGGRFWHVAGPTSKGAAMDQILQRYRVRSEVVSAAIGDSAIDQSMLDRADYPIGIRVEGQLNVQVNSPPGIIPSLEGARGWCEAVTNVLSQLGYD